MNQPEVIGDRYRVVRALGKGGMGTVWLCDDPVLGRQVALKQIAAGAGIDGKSIERAHREARTVAAVTNPHVVEIHDVIEGDDDLWLVMEYVESTNLQALITERGRMPFETAVRIGAQLAEGLAAAHAAGVVHRDVKPANILVTPEGDAKLVDFGIARSAQEEQVTIDGVISGTPVYFSPELARTGEPDFPSDVWALGATLFAAVEGKAPYDDAGTPVAMLHRVIEEEPRVAIHAGALESPINAMMDRDPDERWTSAQAADALRQLEAVQEATMLVAEEHPLVDSATRHLAEQVVAQLPSVGAGAVALGGPRAGGPAHLRQSASGKAGVLLAAAVVLLMAALVLWWLLR